jgi:hypothetical protein
MSLLKSRGGSVHIQQLTEAALACCFFGYSLCFFRFLPLLIFKGINVSELSHEIGDPLGPLFDG